MMFKKLIKKAPSAEQINHVEPDITHVETQHAPRAESILLNTLLTLTNEGIWTLENPGVSDNKPIIFSPKAKHILGLVADNDIGMGALTQMIHQDEREAFRLFLRHVISHKAVSGQRFDCRIKAGESDFQWFRLTATCQMDEVPHRLIGLVENVDEEILQARRYDIVSTRFDLSREMLNDGLWDLDIIGGDPMNAGNVFWWSPQFRKLLGFETVDEFPDVIESWTSRLHPEDKAFALESFTQHLMDRSGRTVFDIEYRLQLRNGQYRWFQARGQTKRAADGTPLRAVGALIDIQGRKDRLMHEEEEKNRRQQTAETAKEIAELVSENGSIAAQIKLISLNASIEAARAGVHGRGFSVIASAIRNLAERTADITTHISRLQLRIRGFAEEPKQRNHR